MLYIFTIPLKRFMVCSLVFFTTNSVVVLFTGDSLLVFITGDVSQIQNYFLVSFRFLISFEFRHCILQYDLNMKNDAYFHKWSAYCLNISELHQIV